MQFKNIKNKAFSIWSVIFCLLAVNFSIIAINSILSTMLSNIKILHNNTNNLYLTINLEDCYAAYKNLLFCQQSSY